MQEPYEFGLNVSGAADTVPLFTLGIVAPKQSYQPYSKYLATGDMNVKGLGVPIAEWYWTFISDADILKLRAYCSGTSAEVYVRTVDDSLTWHTYKAIMVWPTDAPDIENDFRLKFALRFLILEVIS